jgi:hypothetical protein
MPTPADTSCETEKAPVTWTLDQPVSVVMDEDRAAKA